MSIISKFNSNSYKTILLPSKEVDSYTRYQVRAGSTNMVRVNEIASRLRESNGINEFVQPVVVCTDHPEYNNIILDGNHTAKGFVVGGFDEIPVKLIPYSEFGATKEEADTGINTLGLYLNSNEKIKEPSSDEDISQFIYREHGKGVNIDSEAFKERLRFITKRSTASCGKLVVSVKKKLRDAEIEKEKATALAETNQELRDWQANALEAEKEKFVNIHDDGYASYSTSQAAPKQLGQFLMGIASNNAKVAKLFVYQKHLNEPRSKEVAQKIQSTLDYLELSSWIFVEALSDRKPRPIL